jgi:predicted metal-dependent phosphotriesterase family hydrolase
MTLKGRIQTIRGPIDPAEFGVAYPSVHLTGGGHGLVWNAKDPDLGPPAPEVLAQEVELFKKAGGNALVEVTSFDFAREIRDIVEVAEKTGIPIVATSGFVRGNWITQHCPWVLKMTEDQLTEFFIREVTQGTDGTEHQIGALKVPGSYQRIDPLEEGVIRAGAQAHLQTGVPLICHSGFGTVGLIQLGILESLGVDPSNVIVSHVDHAYTAGVNFDFYELEEIAEKGAFVCFNQVGRPKYGPDSARIDTIIRLAQHDLLSRVLISGLYARKSEFQVTGGGPGLTHVLSTFVPRLKKASARSGLDPEDVFKQVCIINPANAFTFA